MLIHFPELFSALVEPSLADNETSKRALFFNPGISASDSTNAEPNEEQEDKAQGDACFQPENLPLTEPVMQGLLQDSMHFGQQFKNSSEMAFFGVYTPEDYFSDSRSTIQQELLQRMDPNGAPVADLDKEIRARAQFVMALAYSLQKQRAELVEIEQGLDVSLNNLLTNTLGLTEDDALDSSALGLDQAVSKTGSVSETLPDLFPWQRMLEAMGVLLPSDASLFVSDTNIIELWKDRDIPFEQLTNDKQQLSATLPIWQFALHRKPIVGAPFLDTKINVIIPA